MAEDIRDVLERQKAAVSELSAQIKRIEQSDMITENRKLTEHCEELSIRCEEAEAAWQVCASENADLKTALYEQHYNEKIRVLTGRQQQIEIFFAGETLDEQNRLTALEQDIKRRIDHTLADLHGNNVNLSHEIYTKLHDLQAEAYARINEARANLAKNSRLSDLEKERFANLKNEPLSGEQIVALSKKNNLERLVGLNLLNIIGVILIIIGVIAAGQFAYLRMGDIWRSAALFALGLVFLVLGEFMNRRRPTIFSLGITAGGVGILYAALAVSYFALGIMGMYAALGICVVITALAFFLSTRYQAQVLLAMALVGGYLPIFSITPERTLLFSMMGYFVLLNLLALSVSFRRKWTVANFVGLGLNILGTIYISFLVWGSQIERIAHIIYITFAMLTYIAIPLVSTRTEKANFRKSDVVLLSVNTLIGSGIIFFNISAVGWGDYLGIASVFFAVLYLAIGCLITRKFQDAKPMAALFYITGLTFFVLFVPFQLDSMWFTLGWLIQGTALSIYGILKSRRGFKLSGFIINGLCLSWFIAFDFWLWGVSSLFMLRPGQHSWSANPLFSWQYFAITAASILILAAFIYKRDLKGGLQKTFKLCTAINLWLYALYLVSRFGNILYDAFPGASLDLNYLILALMCVVTLLLAAIFVRISILLDAGMKIISTALNLIGIAGILVLSVTASPVLDPMAAQATGIVALATAILLALSVIGAFAVYDVTRRAVLEDFVPVQYLPLTVSAYIVILFTIHLIHAYGLSFTSFWITIAYVLTALLWTILGFAKRYALLRRFGLGLALLSVAKLFLLDLAALTQGFRILSYFILGAVLVGISFVYQHFSKRLELSIPQDEQVSEQE